MKEVTVISTVVQRSLSGKPIPTGNTIIVNGSGGSVDVDAIKKEMQKDFLPKRKDDTAEGRINFRKGIGIVDKMVDSLMISSDEKMESDSSIPSTKFVFETFIRKDRDDRSVGKISSDVGFEAGEFVPEATGAACYQDEEGNWHIETDHLRIRKKAVFTEIEVQEVHHVGGQMMLTSANMIVDYVYEMTDRYRCYFRNVDGDGREVENLWKTGDQAYCNTFNLTKQSDGTLGNHYLWRLVVGTNLDTSDDADERTFGDVTIQTAEYNFTDLSKTECASLSDVPFASDEIVSLGYQPDDDPNRQNAIIIAGAGSGSPYIYEFTGINSFNLPEPETRIKPGDNLFSGMMRIQGGSTGAKNLEDFPEEVFKAVHIGAVNLLLNSGFTGDYCNEDLNSSSSLNSDSELYSKPLKHWTGSATVSDDASAVSGKSAVIGSLAQSVQLMAGESYVVSFKAKGTNVKVMLGGDTIEQTLTPEYMRYAIKFVSDGVGTFSISGSATLCDLQLERGTIATDWHPSPYDNDKTMAEFLALKYIQDAIVEGDTTIIGGLILSSMIQLGNYKDGAMKKVNAGMSGIYNDDNDVAFWGGGTFEQAIRTVIRFKQNPNYRPTEAEWKDLANFVVSHGGDLFLRGYIHAKGGIMESVKSPNGDFSIDKDGNVIIKGLFETSSSGNRIVIDPDTRTITMRVGTNTGEINVVELSFEEYGDSYDYGVLRLHRSQIGVDEYGNEYPIPVDDVTVSPMGIGLYRVGNPSMNLTNEGLTLTHGDSVLHVGLKPVFGGDNLIEVTGWVSDIYSNAWPTSADDTSAGGVYNDNGTLKVKS